MLSTDECKKEHTEKGVKQSYVKNLDTSDFFSLGRDESFSCIKHKLRINVIDEIRKTSGLSICKTLPGAKRCFSLISS